MRKTQLAFVVAALALPAVAAAQPAPAKKKTPPACGAKILPMVVGNTWKYTNVLTTNPVREDLAKIVPPPAKTVTITVKNIETKDKETTITLEEVSTYDAKTFKRSASKKKGKDKPKKEEEKKDEKKDDKKDDKKEDDVVTVTSKIVCGDKKFEISPESFFFAGEPGGAQDVAFTKFERKKDTGWKLTNGNFQEGEWTEEIYASWKRSAPKGQEADMGSGRLEMERRHVPQEPTSVNTISEDGKSFRTWPKVEKMQLVISGRVFLDNSLAPEKKPCSMKETVKDDKGQPVKDEKGNEKIVEKFLDHCPLPAGWVNELYFVQDVGMLQVINTYAHRYSLVKYDVDR